MSVIQKDIELLDPKFKPYAQEIMGLIALHNLPFKLFETRRTRYRQEELVKKGFSKTLNSLHIDGLAADFVLYIDGKYTWEKKYYYDFLGNLVLEKLGEHVRWGGKFKSFYDGPHFEYHIIKV